MRYRYALDSRYTKHQSTDHPRTVAASHEPQHTTPHSTSTHPLHGCFLSPVPCLYEGRQRQKKKEGNRRASAQLANKARTCGFFVLLPLVFLIAFFGVSQQGE
jgi:hypothetical protein